jgi:hypothetical protein
MVRGGIGLAAVAVALLAIGGLASAHTFTYASNLTISNKRAAGGEHFAGRARSPKKACRRGRLVRVHQGTELSDTRIGSARTDRFGRWSLAVVPSISPGKYIAEIRRKRIPPRVGHVHICPAVVTDVLVVSG